MGRKVRFFGSEFSPCRTPYYQKDALPVATLVIPQREVQGHVLVSDLMVNYVSSDFCAPMYEVSRLMEEAWLEDTIKDPDEWNPGEIEHGGPGPYIAHLVCVMSEEGWVGDPLHILGENIVVDGHHRFVAAVLMGMSTIPVYYD